MEESLLLRQIPHSVEAEQSVLGAMLIDARCIPDVIEALHPEDFYLKTNREIYETIYAMFNFSAYLIPFEGILGHHRILWLLKVPGNKKIEPLFFD